MHSLNVLHISLKNIKQNNFKWFFLLPPKLEIKSENLILVWINKNQSNHGCSISIKSLVKLKLLKTQMLQRSEWNDWFIVKSRIRIIRKTNLINHSILSFVLTIKRNSQKVRVFPLKVNLVIRLIIIIHSVQKKMKFPVKDIFSKCDQMPSFLRIWSHLLKKSLMENYIFCAVSVSSAEAECSWVGTDAVLSSVAHIWSCDCRLLGTGWCFLGNCGCICGVWIAWYVLQF